MTGMKKSWTGAVGIGDYYLIWATTTPTKELGIP